MCLLVYSMLPNTPLVLLSRILYALEYQKKKKERLLGVPQVSGDMALGVAQLYTMH